LLLFFWVTLAHLTFLTPDWDTFKCFWYGFGRFQNTGKQPSRFENRHTRHRFKFFRLLLKSGHPQQTKCRFSSPAECRPSPASIGYLPRLSRQAWHTPLSDSGRGTHLPRRALDSNLVFRAFSIALPTFFSSYFLASSPSAPESETCRGEFALLGLESPLRS
jgi:hypothetical protein